MIVLGKRAAKGNPYEGEESDSDTEWWKPSSSQSSPARDYASGNHPGFDMPSSPSGGSESPLWSKVWSTPGGTEASSSPDTTKVHFFHDGPEELGLPHPPGREGYLAKVAGQQSPEIEHASTYFEPPPSPPPPKPQSKGFISNFKSYFGKLAGKLGPTFERTASNFKTLFSKLGRVNFRPGADMSLPGFSDSPKAESNRRRVVLRIRWMRISGCSERNAEYC